MKLLYGDNESANDEILRAKLSFLQDYKEISCARGVGFNSTFVDSNLDVGTIYLDDPAVGKHHFSTSGNFKYKIENPNGNSYTVTITKS